MATELLKYRTAATYRFRPYAMFGRTVPCGADLWNLGQTSARTELDGPVALPALRRDCAGHRFHQVNVGIVDAGHVPICQFLIIRPEIEAPDPVRMMHAAELPILLLQFLNRYALFKPQDSPGITALIDLGLSRSQGDRLDRRFCNRHEFAFDRLDRQKLAIVIQEIGYPPLPRREQISAHDRSIIERNLRENSVFGDFTIVVSHDSLSQGHLPELCFTMVSEWLKRMRN